MIKETVTLFVLVALAVLFAWGIENLWPQIEHVINRPHAAHSFNGIVS